MPKFDPAHEERIVKCIASFPDNGIVNIASKSREFVVDYEQLRRRWAGVENDTTRGGSNARLSDAQDLALVKRIKSQIKHGFVMKPGAIVACAEWILAPGVGKSELRPKHLSKHWFPRWAKRHPELHPIIDKVIANDRKSAGSAYEIKEWFQLLKTALYEYDIDDGDIWNFDETGFQVGDLKSGTIVWVPREIKAVYKRTPGNRKLVTCVECISARGEALPTFFIIKSKSLPERHIRDWKDQGHDPDSSWTFSDSGFINSDLAAEWLNHFLECTHIPTRSRRTRKPPCLLLMNEHTSHLTPNFIDRCWEAGIVPFALLPHTTHILQPLDVCLFQPYKYWHQVVIGKWIAEGAFDFGQDDFLRCQPEIKAFVFKKATIRKSFEVTGIWPFNPNHVLLNMGQWLDRKSLTPQQEVARWQIDFMPIDPYEIIIVDGERLPAKTRREIDKDLAFNAREQRRRYFKDIVQREEVYQAATSIIIGESRPKTPPPQHLLIEDDFAK
jgi:hypothetical protein